VSGPQVGRASLLQPRIPLGIVRTRNEGLGWLAVAMKRGIGRKVRSYGHARATIKASALIDSTRT